ncbi:MAG: BamA/TamA family outer membrane protein [Saprospiraceae bacterium]
MSFVLLTTFAFANDFYINNNPEVDSTEKKSRNFAILPLIFYTPETSLAFGVGGTYSFRFKDEPETSRPSQFVTGLSYTLENQILSYLSFQLFKNDEQYKIYGEIGFYRYFFYFYGVGNDEDVILNEENNKLTAYREPYDVVFPRIKLNALREVSPNLYVGLQGWFDNQRFTGVDSSDLGRLKTGTLTGSDGGVIAQLGTVVNYDDRNNVFYPTEGHLIELLATFNSKSLGSDFNFQRYAFDAAKYITFKKKHTVALHATGDFIVGDAPFFQLAELGGTKRMRGYFQGRYRDNNALIVQAEYRVPILQNVIKSGFFKDRFKIAVFGSLGNVAPTIGEFDLSNTRYAYGAGLRFRLTDAGINLRLDYGRTAQGSNFYVTFNEAI